MICCFGATTVKMWQHIHNTCSTNNNEKNTRQVPSVAGDKLAKKIKHFFQKLPFRWVKLILDLTEDPGSIPTDR